MTPVCLHFLQVPFPVLQGEGVEYLGQADEAIIAISNYRLHIKYKDSVINVSASDEQTLYNGHLSLTLVFAVSPLVGQDFSGKFPYFFLMDFKRSIFIYFTLFL